MFPPQENQNPGAQVAGGDDEFAQFVRQTVAEEIARSQAQNQPNPQNPAAPVAQVPQVQAQPIAVNLNGQTFTFQSQDELNRALANTFAAYNNQISQLQSQNAQPKGQEVTGQDDAKIDINQFVEKLGTNPVEAFEYIDKARFGFDNPSKVLKEMVDKVTRQEQVLAAYQFKEAHPYFPANPQAAQTLYQILQARNLPATAEGLEAAYALGVTNGIFPHPAMAQQVQNPQNGQARQQNPYAQPQNPYAVPEQPQFAPQGPADPRFFNGGMNFNQNPYLQAPPRAPRATSDAAPDLYSMADDMTPEQIEAVFRRLQQ